jgi:ribosomal protein S18 acetylase RimI-like enzyme
MRYRAYQPDDLAACLEILASNQEHYFSPGDREALTAFLANPPGFYGVVESADGRVIACGGYAADGAIVALTWGMVHADLHGRGIGRFLLQERLRCIAAIPGVEKVVLNTSQETLGFYLKLGFKTVKQIPNGYRLGLDRCDLERRVI